MAGPNVSGMVNDPQFQSLAPMQQREALFKLTGDSSFNKLSDGDTLQFVNKMRTPATPQAAVPVGTISAIPNQGIQNKVVNWLSDLEGDVRHGTGMTLPGRILQKMGARGTDMGVPESVSNYVASPVLGPIKTAQGVAEGNVGKTVSGIAQTATLPSSFVAPQAAESTISKIPNKDWAGKAIGIVEQAAKDQSLKVSPDASGRVAMRINDIAKSGASLPPPVKAFVNRITKLAGKGPIDFQEARDIYSNATGRLSQDDINKLTPKMAFYLGQFARALHQDITASATTIGQGPLYQEAMQNYAQASKMQALLARGAKYGAATAAGALGYEGAKRLMR